jgi:hypothetical protein
MKVREESDERVLEKVRDLVGRSNAMTAELLVYLAEVEERRLYLGEATSSLFAWCVERLHMSEDVAANRIRAARAVRRFPLIGGMIARGEVHLAGVVLLAPHLTEENHRDLLARARHRSKRAIEKLVAEIAPRPDVDSRVRALPQGRVVASPAPPAASPPAAATVSSANGAVAVTSGQRRRPAVVAPLAPRRYEIRVTVGERRGIPCRRTRPGAGGDAG